MIHIVVGPELENYLIDRKDNGFSIVKDSIDYISFDNNAVVYAFPEANKHISKTTGIVNGILNNILLSNEHNDHVIMTHSASIIDYMGELIEDGKISHNDVTIHVLYDERWVKSHHFFNSEGVIDGGSRTWPFGLMNSY